jgi:hypothetical protein
VPSRLPAASRRAVLGAALLGVAGCSLDDLDPTSDDPTFTPSSGASASGTTRTEPADDPADPGAADDAVLVEGVLAALALAHRTARSNARTHADLAPSLLRLVKLHTTHADELGPMPRSRGRVVDAAETPEQVLARVDGAEGRLQQALVEAALAASSGALAQTLASMAAATAQLRSVVTSGGTA